MLFHANRNRQFHERQKHFTCCRSGTLWPTTSILLYVICAIISLRWETTPAHATRRHANTSTGRKRRLPKPKSIRQIAVLYTIILTSPTSFALIKTTWPPRTASAADNSDQQQPLDDNDDANSRRRADRQTGALKSTTQTAFRAQRWLY